MQPQAVQKVLVAGGGIAGLVAAIALQRAGIDVTVFERVKEQQEVGAGLSLWANAIRALQKIGLSELLASIGKPLPRQCILSWQGDILSETPVKTLAERYGTPLVVMHRADLQAALLQAVGEGVVQSGVTCTGFQQDETGVRIRLADGREVSGDLLLGADGIHSTIRAQLFGAAKPRYAGYTAWRGIAPTTPEHWNEQMATETMGNGRRFGLVPLSQGRIYWFATLNTPEGTPDPERGRKQQLLKLFHACHSPVPAVIEATDEAAILHNDIYDRPPLHTWSNGRITLLGDAAHPMTPNMGQGACQAIEDAVALAACLTTEPTVASALQAYETQRLKRANTVVQRSHRIGQVFQLERPLAVRVRNSLFKMLPTQLLLRQVEWVLKD
jgi:2-polyprenyl-6-methoxyphenol hydroxylase-like FAD-dependent oxidoreductase